MCLDVHLRNEQRESSVYSKWDVIYLGKLQELQPYREKQIQLWVITLSKIKQGEYNYIFIVKWSIFRFDINKQMFVNLQDMKRKIGELKGNKERK